VQSCAAPPPTRTQPIQCPTSPRCDFPAGGIRRVCLRGPLPKGDPLRLCHRRDRRLRPGLLGKTSLMFLVHPLSPPMKWPTSRGGASCGEPGLPVGLFAQTLRELMVAPLLATSAAGHWLAWSWKRSGGGAGWWLRSPRRLLTRCPRGTPPPEATPELLQCFDTATQTTALANWLRHQPSPRSALGSQGIRVGPAHLPTPSPSEHRKLLRDALRLTLWRATGSTGAWLAPEVVALKRADCGV
jgi:hypothetical protein